MMEMSAGRSKVESGSNPPRSQHGLSLVIVPAAVPGRVSAAADAAAARSESEFPQSTIASDTGQDRPTGQYQTDIPYHSRLSWWSEATIRCHDIVSMTLVCLSYAHPTAGEAPLLCSLCLCNWDAVSSPPAAAANVTRVYLLMCVPRPVPIHYTAARTAGDGCYRETAGGRLPSCLTLITCRGNKQTTNVSACKFAETRLTVKRQRYPIID